MERKKVKGSGRLVKKMDVWRESTIQIKDKEIKRVIIGGRK